MVAAEVEEFGSSSRVYAQLHFGFSMIPEPSFIVAVEGSPSLHDAHI